MTYSQALDYAIDRLPSAKHADAHRDIKRGRKVKLTNGEVIFRAKGKYQVRKETL